MSERAVEFYRKENGRIPVEEFLDELPMKHREKAIRSLMLLEEFGELLGEPYIKYMGDDIFELRIWIRRRNIKKTIKGGWKMSDLSAYIKKQLDNPEFRDLYEKSEGEYQVAREIIKARIERQMTQKELSEKTGIRQSNISRIENGNCSPTVETLEKIAEGLGKKLEIRFV